MLELKSKLWTVSTVTGRDRTAASTLPEAH